MPYQESFEQNAPKPRRASSQNNGASGRRQGDTGDGNLPKQKRKNGSGGGNRWFRALVMVLITLGGCIFLALFILQTANDVFGLNQADRTIEVQIPDGSSNQDVAKILNQQGVVENSFVFRIYSGLKTKDREFQPGTYMLNSNLGYDEIIVILKRGDNQKEEVRLTFREGRTLAEIASFLEEYNVCSAEEFIAYLEVCDYNYEFFNAMPDDEHRFRRLEGYIFPDTYDFYVGESVEDVAAKFLRNFNTKLTDELQERMMEMNMTVDETIILASIIQKEAGKVEDMRMVSGVFHNRMAISDTFPNLQSDVTIFYVNNDIKPYLQQADQDMYDAYNTYECVGLPVGAICNPGMDAIEAALFPTESEYYYFVTDINEEFYYATTLEEHNRNVSTAKAVGGNAHGIATQ